MSSLAWLLVPGGWHPGHLYQPLLDELRKSGDQTVVITNRSLGQDGEKMTVQDDAKQVNDTICRLADQGQDVVVICHSYGAIPAHCGSYGLSKSIRQGEDKPGGVIGIISIASGLPIEGKTFIEATASDSDDEAQQDPFYETNVPSEGWATVRPETAIQILYKPDMDDATAQHLAEHIKP